ncbi:MAG: YdcF family protein [Candidatus Xenobia bacterium]
MKWILALPRTLPQILAQEKRDDRERCDCILVPGSIPRLMHARVAHAVTLYRAGAAPDVIVSGAWGEAEMAQQQAIQAGLPELHVHLETRARNTWENIERSRAIMAAHGWQTCLIVSDGFHLHRCLHMATCQGLDAKASAAPAGIRGLLRLRWVLQEAYSLHVHYALSGTRF